MFKHRESRDSLRGTGMLRQEQIKMFLCKGVIYGAIWTRNNPLHLKDSKAGSNQGLLKNIKLYAEIKIK